MGVLSDTISKPISGTLSASISKAISGQTLRQVLTLNGLDQVVIADRVNDIDLDNPNFELEGYFDLTSTGTMWAQSISATALDRELHAFTVDSTSITIILGGTSHTFNLSSSVKQDAALWSIRVDVSNVTLFKNGIQIGQVSTNVGPSRESTATFKVGACGGGTDTTYDFFLSGQVKDQKIWVNGNKNTGTLVFDAPLADGFAKNPVAVNNASTQGPDVWSYGDPVTVGQTPQFNTIAGSFGDTNITIGDTFVWSFNISDMVSTGKLTFIFGGIPNTVFENTDGNGTHNIIVTNASSQALVIQEGAASFGSENTIISEISVKNSPLYGRYIGLTSGSWSEEIA